MTIQQRIASLQKLCDAATPDLDIGYAMRMGESVSYEDHDDDVEELFKALPQTLAALARAMEALEEHFEYADVREAWADIEKLIK